MNQDEIRYNWTREEIKEIYKSPFPSLVATAQAIHSKYYDNTKVQKSTLLSIKTGACPEDCKYCPQSAHYNTGVEKHKLLPKEFVIEQALRAKSEGSTRFCMGAAWRKVNDGKDFDHVLDLVKTVDELGMEVCCTLGMLTESQAKKLKDAGCHSYNHNLDTSPEYYGEVITTRTYQDRLDTIANVRSAGINVCCGGIIGMGESEEDRYGLLQELANQSPHPESVPINMLVKVKGTPFDEAQDISSIDFIRMIATARIIMPTSMVRLSAGRNEMSAEMQALCFIAGANSVFAGEKLLTTPNPKEDADSQLIKALGMSFVDNSVELQKGIRKAA